MLGRKVSANWPDTLKTSFYDRLGCLYDLNLCFTM
jgi:hypothetical protein